MEGLRQYVFSVITAALICGILSSLIQKGPGKELVRMFCGLFLTLTVLQPILRLDFSELAEYTQTFSLEADAVVTAGEQLAQEAMEDIIKAEAEAYILDKAAELNAELSVDVGLDSDQLPVSAELKGKLSPYARGRIADILASDLGITKENQKWSG